MINVCFLPLSSIGIGGRELIAIAVMYQLRKGPLAGPMFKIPLVGPFLPALYPDFEKYKRQWASGDLSCVSVFHK